MISVLNIVCIKYTLTTLSQVYRESMNSCRLSSLKREQCCQIVGIAGYSTIVQWNLNISSLFRNMLFSTKCCQIEAIAVLEHLSAAEF